MSALCVLLPQKVHVTGYCSAQGCGRGHPVPCTDPPDSLLQRESLFYPGWVYTIPTAILRVPFSLVEGVTWSVIVFFLVGLNPSPGRYVA